MRLVLSTAHCKFLRSRPGRRHSLVRGWYAAPGGGQGWTAQEGAALEIASTRGLIFAPHSAGEWTVLTFVGGRQPQPGSGRPSGPIGHGASRPGTPCSPLSPLSPFRPRLPSGP